ncbi:hypothetical protein K438DRAFT_1764108 [Mycena galopus ATCC 62051]|nr:hypothetical protein K438DRAFT_1764108 [Mycena galopus ATCC 62051]
MWDEATGPAILTLLSALTPAPDHIPSILMTTSGTLPSGSDETISAAEAYVKEHFSQRLERIHHTHAITCGTTYRHCTEEKNVTISLVLPATNCSFGGDAEAIVCNTLGLANTNRGFSPVVINGIRIAYEDAVSAASLKENMLGVVHTQVGQAREARRTLARTLSLHHSGWTAANEAEAALELRHREVLEIFSVILREGDIADLFLEDVHRARSQITQAGFVSLPSHRITQQIIVESPPEAIQQFMVILVFDDSLMVY